MQTFPYTEGISYLVVACIQGPQAGKTLTKTGYSFAKSWPSWTPAHGIDCGNAENFFHDWKRWRTVLTAKPTINKPGKKSIMTIFQHSFRWDEWRWSEGYKSWKRSGSCLELETCSQRSGDLTTECASSSGDRRLWGFHIDYHSKLLWRGNSDAHLRLFIGLTNIPWTPLTLWSLLLEAFELLLFCTDYPSWYLENIWRCCAYVVVFSEHQRWGASKS